MLTTDALKYLPHMGLDPSRAVGCAGAKCQKSFTLANGFAVEAVVAEKLSTAFFCSASCYLNEIPSNCLAEGVMRRSQVCKHQVCDYCGECFDMELQRWWGNKFCKMTCKNAYLRENGVARLAAALAVAVLMLLLLVSAKAAPSEEQAPAGVSLEFNKQDGSLYIDLSGPIVASTADDVRLALGKYGTALNRVVLFLDSAGGRVDDGDRLIEALNEIKLRHQLITVVPHGKLCASMCIPIFLQGEDRLAARASIWLFHEAAQRKANGALRTDTAET